MSRMSQTGSSDNHFGYFRSNDNEQDVADVGDDDKVEEEGDENRYVEMEMNTKNFMDYFLMDIRMDK